MIGWEGGIRHPSGPPAVQGDMDSRFRGNDRQDDGNQAAPPLYRSAMERGPGG